MLAAVRTQSAAANNEAVNVVDLMDELECIASGVSARMVTAVAKIQRQLLTSAMSAFSARRSSTVWHSRIVEAERRRSDEAEGSHSRESRQALVEVEGKGEPLLLIAGGRGFSHAYLHPFFSALADHCQLIYFDAFGTGKSGRAKAPDDYTVARDVDNIESLRSSLGFDHISISATRMAEWLLKLRQ